MGSPYDSIGAYPSMNDYFTQQCLLAAMKAPNASFRGSNSSVNKTEETDTTNKASENNDGAIPVRASKSQDGSEGITLTEGIFGAALLAGGAYMLVRGHKSGWLGKIWNKVRGKSSESASSVADRLKSLTAVKCPDGKIRFNIPEKTTTCSGNKIQNLVNEYGIKGAISAERQAYNPVTSAINSFRVTVGSDKFVVFAKDGSITKIVDTKGENILKRLTDAESKSADANMLEKFQDIVKELGKEKDLDRTVLNGVKDITYTNTYGDDVLKMTLEKYGADPKLREFTTLKRFNFNDNEIQTLKLGANETVFSVDKFYRDGKLIDGVSVAKFSDKIGGGNIGHFEGQELVSITKPNGTIVEKGSYGYSSIVNEYQKDIDKLIRKVFIKREYIPTGATIQAA